MKNLMSKKISRLILGSLFLGYIAFSLITLPACSGKKDGSSYELQLANKNDTAKQLIRKFGAELFAGNISGIQNKTVVLDSIVLGIKESSGDYYIKARVKSGRSDKYYAELKCTKEIAEQFHYTKSSAAYLAAKIKRVDSYNLIAEADSIDGSKSDLHIGKIILLSGECLALAEIPPLPNAN